MTRNLEWAIDVEFATRLFTSACHYCGRQGCDDGLVGIDRKENSAGYTEANCLPCCEMCNKAKNTRSYEEMIAYIDAVAKHRAQQV